MKVGVRQFSSWSRRIPLTIVNERAVSRIEVTRCGSVSHQSFTLFADHVLPKLW